MPTFRVVLASPVIALALAACSTADEPYLAADDATGATTVAAVDGPAAPTPSPDDLVLRSGSTGDLGTSPDTTAALAPPTLATDGPSGAGDGSGPVTADPSAAGPTTTAAPVSADTAPTTAPTTGSADGSDTVSSTTTTSDPSGTGATSLAASSTSSPTSAVTSPSSTSPVTVATPGDLAAGEGHALGLLNALRGEAGVGELVRVADLDTKARSWSQHMAETGEFEHSDGDEGENIAFTSDTALSAAEAADLFHQLWVDSAEHYTNMTDGRFAGAGIGLYLTERGWYGTLLFSFDGPPGG